MVSRDSFLTRPIRRGQPENTSAEEQAMREAIAIWARWRWGVDMRIIHEIALRDRRLDMLIVLPSDLIGIEVKGPRDRLGDGRLSAQLREFGFFVPEVWLIVDKKWADHDLVREAFFRANVAVVSGGTVTPAGTVGLDPKRVTRDEMCCSRLIELLWNAELIRAAKRAGLPIEPLPGKYLPMPQVRAMMARLMTGQEIMKAVCAELRERPLVGIASDDVVSAGAPA